jgi:hypothetical protein
MTNINHLLLSFHVFIIIHKIISSQRKQYERVLIKFRLCSNLFSSEAVLSN